MHRDAEIKALANELKTQIHFIPAGMTDKLEPMDGTEIALEHKKSRLVDFSERGLKMIHLQ